MKLLAKAFPSEAERLFSRVKYHEEMAEFYDEMAWYHKEVETFRATNDWFNEMLQAEPAEIHKTDYVSHPRDGISPNPVHNDQDRDDDSCYSDDGKCSAVENLAFTLKDVIRCSQKISTKFDDEKSI